MLQLVIGVILVIVAILAYWIALPRDGLVRGFLRNDHVQAYYSVLLVCGFACGVILAASGISSLLS